MSEPVPAYAQQAYAIIRARFADESFSSDYLSWFVSEGMVKKILHVLEHSGWIERVERGRYVCTNPEKIFRSMIEFRVPELLRQSGMKYAYADASAVEIWTDYSYIQRSWEHSPYYVRVLKGEVKKWVDYFRKHRVEAFVSKAEPSLGEFVILKPEGRLTHESHNDAPVEPLEAVVRYCEKHIDTFDYPLAYLTAKFKIKSSVEIDKRVLLEASRAVA